MSQHFFLSLKIPVSNILIFYIPDVDYFNCMFFFFRRPKQACVRGNVSSFHFTASELVITVVVFELKIF